MTLYYTKEQVDAQATLIGTTIKTAVDPATMKANIATLPDTNFLTDTEMTKFSGLESNKFLGTFLTVESIPTTDATAGSYADVDAGVGQDTERYIYDLNDNKFVKSVSQISGETAASIKLKYESNPNTNTYTDAEKAKLAIIPTEGVKGDKGDTGERGAQGIQGLQGLQGLQGITGAKGDTGLQGIQGEKGDRGIQGLTGLQGVAGLRGLQGEKGDNGDTVLDANTGLPLKIWTGTQVEYDSVVVKDSSTLYLVKP